MATKKDDGYNELSDVRITRVGLCKSPAVPEATHVLLKSRDGEMEEIRRCDDPARRVADDNGIAKALENAVSGIMGIIAKLRKSEQTITENDMDIAKATAEEIQKANPALYDAIVAKAVESLKEKNGSRVGAEDVQGTVDEKDGKRLGAVKVAGATEAAVDTRQSTTKEPLAAQPTGGFDPSNITKAIEALQKGLGECTTTLKAMCDKVEKFDTSRPGEAATAKEEKAAVKATQAAVDAAAGESNGGVAKVDTSRPGEAAIAGKEKAAVKATQNAVDAAAAAGDSGIGGQAADGDPDKEADAALKAELSTVKDQVGTLTKALPDLQKAVAMLIRKSVEQTEVVVGKTAVTGTIGNVSKAGSQQAGQLTEAGARAEREVGKSTFASAISTIALAKAGRSVE